MQVINVRNVHEALPEAIHQLLRYGVRRESRNGPTLTMPHPVTTLYREPTERVVFWAQRDANPFFHLFESLWMLGGRRDVAYPQQFAGNIASYSDDGKNFHAAYGYRWRKAFRFDQLAKIGDALRADHTDRRQVLGIWSPDMDLNVPQGSMKDLPCNLTAHFQVSVHGALDMTVFNRSNDIIWGCYGANAVHFSMLLEYMAHRVGVPVGRYWQISDNWHGYLKTLEPLAELQMYAPDPYRLREPNPYDDLEPYPLLMTGEDVNVFDEDVQMFLDEGANCMGYRSKFIRRVALPMLQAWRAYKEIEATWRYSRAIEILDNCQASDWRVAAVEWISRRRDRQPVATPAA